MTIFLILAIVFMLIMIWQTNKSRIIYLKNLMLPMLCIIFILCLLLFSSTAFESAKKGLNLWLYVVFPSLFPFFVASEILKKSGFIKSIGILLEPIMRPLFNIPGCGSFALAMGITSGYPVGAKITASLREDDLLSRNEAERLLAFSNNSGPLFIAGSVAVGMLKLPDLGVILLISHIAASLTVGFVFRFLGRNKNKFSKNKNRNLIKRFRTEYKNNALDTKDNFGGVLGESIKNSVQLILMIGGFIIFFSVIINLLLQTGIINYFSSILAIFLSPFGFKQGIISAMLSGFIEITTGINMICGIESLPILQKLVSISILIGWAGISVHAQVISILVKTDIRIGLYLSGKFLHGILSAIYIVIIYKLFELFYLKSISTFLLFREKKSLNGIDIFFQSCKFLSITLLILSVLFIFKYLTTLKNDKINMLNK